MNVLHIPAVIYDLLRAHGEETYPHECCGVLLGEFVSGAWRVTAAVRAGNMRTDSAHNRYMIDPADLVRIQRDAMRQGLDVAGFYHSHPDHPAQWSSTDLAEAHWIGCSYVITAVAEGKAELTNAFLLAGATEEDKRFELQTIRVDESIDANPNRIKISDFDRA
jgi:proteasome lid subunit RPN8/RPN11